MCRHLAYLGPPRTLDALLLRPRHSLLRQSYAPADMRGGGTLNADGYGVAWYPDGEAEPVRLRRTCAMWADENLVSVARRTAASAVVAAVRSATVGMPVVETAAAPFVAGRWLFSHNGLLPGWPDSVEHLAAPLRHRDLMTLEAPTDSAFLWALLLRRLQAGEDPVAAVGGLSGQVVAADPRARLNLLLCDGQQVVATTWTHALSVLVADDVVAVASEPWDDDPAWRPVPDRHLVHARIRDGRPRVETTPLHDLGSTGTRDGAR